MKVVALASVLGVMLSACTTVPAAETTEPAASVEPVFAYDAGNVVVHELGNEMRGDAVLREVTYPSPRGGEVPATLIMPRHGRSGTAVIFLHGGGAGGAENLPSALTLAKVGVASLLVDAPFARAGGPPLFTFDAATDRDVHHVQAVVDVRRGIDVLQQEGFLTDRIGVYGHSYGAVLGAIVAGVDDRIGPVVLASVGAEQSKFLRSLAERTLDEDDLDAYETALRAVDPGRYIGFAKGPLLLQFGADDPFVSDADAEALVKAAPSPEVKHYRAGHELNERARCDALRWLAGHLNAETPRCTG